MKEGIKESHYKVASCVIAIEKDIKEINNVSVITNET